ncbi:hypothetical protein H6G00_01555 [Leptolyngbya sp. FACHB-541]|uniref:hypothetical protein n=1 Tax=Leptolyngbya sp. FACHB-541 TaxID=2692810 RepID=UPI001687755D|nr:hypothetical protein [Leptolyngbya sp. FACHB-541]MBD1995316.1 hypothetical protein [Leptolyngbya sp. FACHB-541]
MPLIKCECCRKEWVTYSYLLAQFIYCPTCRMNTWHYELPHFERLLITPSVQLEQVVAQIQMEQES